MIVDDHGVLRAGLHALLTSEPDFEVVGEAESGEQALRRAPGLRPDVILMDISMPDLGGIETTRRMTALLPHTKVLILTVHEDKAILQEAVRSGASGYILKRALKAELFGAIQAVMRGDLYVHPALMRALIPSGVDLPAAGVDPAQLTPRELEVLRLIAQGYTNSQVGEKLGISVRTVEFHRGNLMNKLNIESRVDLVRYAADHHL
jgi:two-component system response regulator NreC